MDPGWEEAERMAQAMTAADAQIADEVPSPETITRWKILFGYSDTEAARLISQQRADLTRDRIADEHWLLVKAEKESAGYDREAYEHSLNLPEIFKGQSATIPTTGKDGGLMFLFRLGGLLDTPEKVQEVVGLEEAPKVIQGMNEMGWAKFCQVDRDVQKKLEGWLVEQAVLQQKRGGEDGA